MSTGSQWSAALAVARKELREGLRDRQTVLYTFLLPVAMYPVLFWVMVQGALLVRGQKDATNVRVELRADPAERETFLEALTRADDLAPLAGLRELEPPPGPVALQRRLKRVGPVQVLVEADRLGAEICGNPLWLASALEKIERGARSTMNIPAERNPAMAHLYIANPLNGRGADNLFTTHPSTANRVEALRRQAAEMGITRAPASPSARREAGPWG